MAHGTTVRLKSLVKSGLDIANRPRAVSRTRRALQGGPPYKVQVGSGPRRLPGWLNTDIGWRADLYLDATRSWPTPPGTVSHIYADNVIEHVRMKQARILLRHAHSALRPGGAIRLVTPDVGRMARAYLDDAELTRAHLERNRRVGHDVHHPIDLLRVTFHESGHTLGYLWDYESLAAELTAAGFVSVQRCELGESEDLDFRGLDSRGSTEPTDVLLTLAVEARKQ